MNTKKTKTVMVTTEHHFNRLPDNGIYTGGSFPYSFWQRHLNVFERVVVLARVKREEKYEPNMTRSDGNSVEFVGIPDYYGSWGFFINIYQIIKAVDKAINMSDVFILRVPGAIGTLAAKRISRLNKGYNLEVLGYAEAMLWAMPRLVAKICRPIFVCQLKRLCLNAKCISYVTKQALQKRYPSMAAYITHCSDVQLPNRFIKDINKIRSMDNKHWKNSHKKEYKILYVGSLAQLYKAPDDLIVAVNRCLKSGYHIALKIIGSGKYKDHLKQMAIDLGIEKNVHFLGQIQGAEMIIKEMDKADLFVLPSHQEGLPKAMIEAMARGLPCIGSSVGGIPELLPQEDMIIPGDTEALANKIIEFLIDPKRMQTTALKNIEISKAYTEDELTKRRDDFYKKCTESTQI